MILLYYCKANWRLRQAAWCGVVGGRAAWSEPIKLVELWKKQENNRKQQNKTNFVNIGKMGTLTKFLIIL